MFANIFCYICNICWSLFHANKNNKASFRTFEESSRSKSHSINRFRKIYSWSKRWVKNSYVTLTLVKSLWMGLSIEKWLLLSIKRGYVIKNAKWHPTFRVCSWFKTVDFKKCTINFTSMNPSRGFSLTVYKLCFVLRELVTVTRSKYWHF